MMKNQFLSLESFVNKTFCWVLNRFVYLKRPTLYGRNPHIGDFPRKNEAVHPWTKPIKSINKYFIDLFKVEKR
jgi:hypothetical protein